MAFSHVAGIAQSALSAALAMPFPAGVVSGDLLTLITSVRDYNGSTGMSTPAGWTLLGTSSPGTNDALWLYGRIADGTESGTVAWDSATGAGQHGVIIRWPVRAGRRWPVIGTAFVGLTEGETAGNTTLGYNARTMAGTDRLGIQIGKEPTTGTVTALGTGAGYTQAYYQWDATTTYVTAAQYIENTGNLSANTVAITGNSGTSATVSLTAEFRDEAATITVAVDDDTPTATQAIVITKSGGNWNGTPTAQLTDNNGANVAMPALTSVSGAVATLTLGAGSVGNYDDSNATWELIRWHQTLTLTVTDGDGSGTDTIVIQAPVLDHFDAQGASPVYPVTGSATSDDSYVHIVSGDGEGLPAICDVQGSTVPTVARFMCFDISADKWLAYREETFDVASVTLDGQYADTFTDINGVAITAHTPTTSIGLGGYTIEKDVSTAAAVSNAVDIQGNTVRINDAQEGFVINVGDTSPHFTFDWVLQPGDTGKQFVAQVRRLDDTEHVHVYVTQAGLIRVNERVASANIAITGTKETTFTGGFLANTTYRFKIEVIGLVITVYVDDVQQVQVTSTRSPDANATKVGLFAAGAATFPIYFDNANVYSDYVAAARTINFSDDTVMPGQTVTLTSSTAHAGTISVLTVNGVAFTPGSADTDSCTLTMSALTAFDAAGAMVNAGWYRNLTVVMGDGVTTATGTLQVVAPTSANYGTVGAGTLAYPPAGTKLNDSAYVDVVSGAGTADPVAVDFTATETSVVRFRVFDEQSEVWLAVVEATIYPLRARVVGGARASLRRGML